MIYFRGEYIKILKFFKSHITYAINAACKTENMHK